jgi:non-ribosomal peptide synthetase component E (peptide arylation enzyme)
VVVVANVLALVQDERVSLDPEKLDELYRRLGAVGAEDVVCRALEHLAHRMSLCEGCWHQRDHSGLRKHARATAAVAEQIGMVLFARVARDIVTAIDHGNEAAIGATLFRLMRVGELSLTALWSHEDLPV